MKQARFPILVGLCALFLLMGSNRALAQTNVKVVNPAASPALTRNVDNPSTNHFQKVVSATFLDTQDTTSLATFLVPAGKHLTIEFISVVGALFSGQVPICSVNVVQGGVGVTHKINVVGVGPAAGINWFVTSQLVRLYADPGTTVLVYLTRKGGTNGGERKFDVSLSGFLN
jgi:hypothetical protein